MKKIFTLFVVLCFTCTSVFARTTTKKTKQSNQTVEASLNNFIKDPTLKNATGQEREEIEEESSQLNDEETAEEASSCSLTTDEQGKQDCLRLEKELDVFFQNVAQGLENATTQQVDAVEEMVRKSLWMTGKGFSAGDVQQRQRAITIAFGLLQIVLNWAGHGEWLSDRVKENAENEVDKMVAYFQRKIAENAPGFSNEELYVKIQHDAFVVLFIPPAKLEIMMQEYPEISYLLSDMLYFFKWRTLLGQKDDKYNSNVNDINAEFRNATHMNSFLAWWMLASIADLKIEQELTGKDDRWEDPADEKNNRRIYDSNAAIAKYYGRIWNGIQGYAVARGIFDKKMMPIRGAYNKIVKNRVTRAIDKDYKDLSDEKVALSFKRIRANYIKAHETASWHTESAHHEAQQVAKSLKKGLRQSTDSIGGKGLQQGAYQKNDSTASGDVLGTIEQVTDLFLSK